MARFDRTIPPGGEGIITLEVNTKNKQGAIHQTARVFTNDPKNSQLTIGVKGNVWAPIHLRPKYATLTGVFGEKTQAIIRLKSQKQTPLVLKIISVSILDKVDVKLKETEKGRAWELRVQNKVNRQASYTGQIKLGTNYSEKPELTIPISGNIRPLVEARPKIINFRRMAKAQFEQLKSRGTPMRRQLTVILNRGADLKINHINVGHSLFKVVAEEEIQPGRAFRLQVEAVPDKLKRGKNSDILQIQTNQNNMEIITVPILLEIL